MSGYCYGSDFVVCSVSLHLYFWSLAESGSFRVYGFKQEIIALTFCFFLICSTSPPGGNQVDGLPPAASCGGGGFTISLVTHE